jgi:nucleotide-binding universal stress UspA family protein
MSYKAILVHVDHSSNAVRRIHVAGNIAAIEIAHVIGAAMTGTSRRLLDALSVDLTGSGIMSYRNTIWQRAEDALAIFEKTMRQHGAVSFEKRLVDDEAAAGISLLARYCDLVVLGQVDRDSPSSGTDADLPAYVAVHGGSPVLIIPQAGEIKSIGERALVGWNGSPEARRAVQNAFPFLKRAKAVHVALFQPSSQPDDDAVRMAADIAAYLGHHEIPVDVIRNTCDETTEGEMGTLLLSLATALSSDLLVMGCYGHLRLREILLGGATRTVLQSTTIPVLMSH